MSVSRETRDRLLVFAGLLERWNARINLVAPGEIGRLWPRHIEDSLQLQPLVPAGTTQFTDLGSGAGFPGLILAMASGIPVTLVEADQRKCAFLREAARVTGTDASVVAARIEATQLPPAPLVTARALAPLPRLLALAKPHLAPGGTCLFLKGASVEDELTAARREWHMRVMLQPSRTDPQGAVLAITGLDHA